MIDLREASLAYAIRDERYTHLSEAYTGLHEVIVCSPESYPVGPPLVDEQTYERCG